MTSKHSVWLGVGLGVIALAACSSSSSGKVSASGGNAGTDAAAGSGGYGSGGSAGSSGSGGAGGNAGSGGALDAGNDASDAGDAGPNPSKLSTCPGTLGVTPLLFCRLGSSTAITNPDVGPGGNPVGPQDFTPGVCAAGYRSTQAGQYVEFPEIDNGNATINHAEGTIAFWFRPEFDLADAKTHYLVQTTGIANANGGLRIVRRNDRALEISMKRDEGGGVFMFIAVLAQSTVESVLKQNVWTHLAFSWKTSPTPSARFYLNDTAFAPTTFTQGTEAVGQASAGESIQIGSPPSKAESMGTFDELKILPVAIH
ncbi:MAG: LamG-like jellyroll fold domain-containing protein [Polyangiaceae bacterium]